jgi:hypothetical protein
MLSVSSYPVGISTWNALHCTIFCCYKSSLPMQYHMASQYVWIGNAVGVFAAGIAIGYGIFLSTSQQIQNSEGMRRCKEGV